MRITVLGIDFADNGRCGLIGLDRAGEIIMRRSIARQHLPNFTADLPVCIMAMTIHHENPEIEGILEAQGHKVHLVEPEDRQHTEVH